MWRQNFINGCNKIFFQTYHCTCKGFIVSICQIRIFTFLRHISVLRSNWRFFLLETLLIFWKMWNLLIIWKWKYYEKQFITKMKNFIVNYDISFLTLLLQIICWIYHILCYSSLSFIHIRNLFISNFETQAHWMPLSTFFYENK